MNDIYGMFLRNFAILGAAISALYLVAFIILPPWFRKFPSDAALTSLKISRKPILLIIFLLGFQRISSDLPLGGDRIWFEKVLVAFTIATTTYTTSQLLTQVVLYYWKQYAEKSEAMWDDVALPILESMLPIIIYILGGSLLLQSLGVNVAGLWIALGGASFVLGFAFKDSLANFLSGLVLLVDTPFQFGDVIMLPDKELAVIKKVGLRVTHVYLVNHHSDMYIPNAVFEKREILNLTRPTPHYYDQLEIPTFSIVDPGQAVQVIENVVLAHPDTMGDIDRKLELLDKFYGFSKPSSRVEQKREAGLLRLKAEQILNQKLEVIEKSLTALSEKIDRFEDEGLDLDELRSIQGDYLEICSHIGLMVQSDRPGNRRKSLFLEEGSQAEAGQDSLLGLVRAWYGAWLKDPDLLTEDRHILPDSWEKKIELLKRRVNQIFQKMSKLSVDETRLDDAVDTLVVWLQETFKRSRVEWQTPKIWMQAIQMTGGPAVDLSKVFVVKFFVDDIKLEHSERGNRVKNELYREVIWQLRQAYLAK